MYRLETLPPRNPCNLRNDSMRSRRETPVGSFPLRVNPDKNGMIVSLRLNAELSARSARYAQESAISRGLGETRMAGNGEKRGGDRRRNWQLKCATRLIGVCRNCDNARCKTGKVVSRVSDLLQTRFGLVGP